MSLTSLGSGLQVCDPIPGFQSGPAELGINNVTVCRNSDPDGRKSFCSGHASSAAVTTVYNIVYLIWSGATSGISFRLWRLQQLVPGCIWMRSS